LSFYPRHPCLGLKTRSQEIQRLTPSCRSSAARRRPRRGSLHSLRSFRSPTLARAANLRNSSDSLLWRVLTSSTGRTLGARNHRDCHEEEESTKSEKVEKEGQSTSRGFGILCQKPTRAGKTRSVKIMQNDALVEGYELIDLVLDRDGRGARRI